MSRSKIESGWFFRKYRTTIGVNAVVIIARTGKISLYIATAIAKSATHVVAFVVFSFTVSSAPSPSLPFAEEDVDEEGYNEEGM